MYVVGDGGELLCLSSFAVSGVFTVMRLIPISSIDKAVACRRCCRRGPQRLCDQGWLQGVTPRFERGRLVEREPPSEAGPEPRLSIHGAA